MIFELCYIEAIKNIAIFPTRDASPPLVLALCACVPLRRVSYNLKSSQKPVSLKVYFVHPACKGKSITMSLGTLRAQLTEYVFKHKSDTKCGRNIAYYLKRL